MKTNCICGSIWFQNRLKVWNYPVCSLDLDNIFKLYSDKDECDMKMLTKSALGATLGPSMVQEPSSQAISGCSLRPRLELSEQSGATLLSLSRHRPDHSEASLLPLKGKFWKMKLNLVQTRTFVKMLHLPNCEPSCKPNCQVASPLLLLSDKYLGVLTANHQHLLPWKC